MIRLFDRINSIDQRLQNLRNSRCIEDYRLYLSLSNELSVFIKAGSIPEKELLCGLPLHEDDHISFCTPKEVESDFFLKHLFEKNHSTVNIDDTRRRMTQFFVPPAKMDAGFPVFTFYSYKGGVGRSTALASCAAYLACHFSRRVVILDCDFEAPGFTNFFMEEPTSPINKEGLVEYFIDETNNDNTNLSRYYWQVSKQFSGSGEIYVFPAGNLDDSEVFDGVFNTHRSHYLNGLTRIDMFSPDVLANQFAMLFSQIKQEINPDLVLIDTRTGFSDIFGLSAFRLSDVVVGFFGNNVQSQPGLDFFLEILKQDSAPRLLLVNSIIPSTHRFDRVKSFTEYVSNYLEQMSIPMETEDRDVQLFVETFYISSNDILNTIGTSCEDYRDFQNLIINKDFSDYNLLFNRIDDILRELISTESREVTAKTGHQLKKEQKKEKEVSVLYEYKHTILNNLKINMPKLYADTIESYSDEFRENRYFYRNCMEDLFNPNKILVIGNKGTGKTYIYRSLKEKDIVDVLKKRANKTGNYLFIQAVDSAKRFDTIKFDNSELNALDYERFWTTYIWNTIMQEKPLGFESSLRTFPICDDTTTCDEFLSIIKDTERIKSIEQELQKLDEFLSKKSDYRIVILFDDLDKIVNPVMWSERVSPLINYCRKMSYRTISTKLFVRSDLYEKTSNLNNKNELKNRSITIEWNREELFAFFFKHLFSHSKKEFFELLRIYRVFPNKFVRDVENTLDKNNNQLPLDANMLRNLCRVFFGEYADVNNNPKFGESYDWFFKNLQNSNGTLSLRPFIDLISISVNQAIEEDKRDKPVLSAYYYTKGKNRAKAVENHFEDLAADSGNEDLRPIIEYIKDHASIKFKRDKLMQKDFFGLLDAIIDNVELNNNKDRDSIIRFLEINGIISQSHIRIYGVAHKVYTFALLYKYYLGLKSSSKRRV